MPVAAPGTPIYEANPNNPSSPNYVPPPPPTAVPVDTTAQNLQQDSQRRLMMLRQQIQGFQNSGINALRRRLAQSGALSSGSMPAGLAGIAQRSNAMRSAGASMAANSNVEGLNAIMGDIRNADYQKYTFDQNYQNQRRLLELQEQMKRDRPDNSWLNPFASGFGSLLTGGV